MKYGNIDFNPNYVCNCTLEEFRVQFAGKLKGADIVLVYNSLKKDADSKSGNKKGSKSKKSRGPDSKPNPKKAKK